MSKILFSVMRNEAPFILEWVAYHRQLGFEKIIIYSNSSTDGTHELLDALCAVGAIIHKRLDPSNGISAQQYAIDDFMQLDLLAQDDMVMHLDADEFLNVKIGDRSLDALIEHVGAAQGMAVAWRRFGDSGNREFRGRFISSAYSMAEPSQNNWDPACKTLFRVGPGFVRIGIHKPRFTPAFWASGKHFLGADGLPVIPDSEDYQNWIDPARAPLVARTATNCDVAQVNHYQLRSAAALAIKYKRGVGSTVKLNAREKYNEDKFDRLNTNQQRDTSALFYEPATRAEMARLLQNPKVRECHETAVQTFRAYEEQFLSDTPARPKGGAVKRLFNALKGSNTPAPALARPERQPRLIVHIGQMKTGTTTLQYHLAGVSDQLKAQGVFYPPSDLPSSAHHELSAVLAGPNEAPGYAAALAGGQAAALAAGQSLIERTKTWLDENPNGTAILSTETISAWNNVAVATPLKALIEDVAGDDYLVVAYVRSPVAGAMSRLQQSLYGQTLLMPPVGLLHMPQLNAFADAFMDHFKVRLFDHDHMINGDIVHDFFNAFLPQVPNLPSNLAPIELNKSLSAEAMILVQDVKLNIAPNGAPVMRPETNLLFDKVRHADLAVEGYAPAKLKPGLIAPLTHVQTDALELQDKFGITFPDIDYKLIGADSHLKLSALRYVREITQFDPARLKRLTNFVLADGEKVKRMIALIEVATQR